MIKNLAPQIAELLRSAARVNLYREPDSKYLCSLGAGAGFRDPLIAPRLGRLLMANVMLKIAREEITGITGWYHSQKCEEGQEDKNNPRSFFFFSNGYQLPPNFIRKAARQTAAEILATLDSAGSQFKPEDMIIQGPCNAPFPYGRFPFARNTGFGAYSHHQLRIEASPHRVSVEACFPREYSDDVGSQKREIESSPFFHNVDGLRTFLGLPDDVRMIGDRFERDRFRTLFGPFDESKVDFPEPPEPKTRNPAADWVEYDENPLDDD
jgi:hypothetical protein